MLDSIKNFDICFYVIFDLFNILAQVRIARSKTILNIYYNNFGTRVASQVAERLRTWRRSGDFLIHYVLSRSETR